ncbi:hypothetical protein [Paraburkholderia susongensis]|uniref:hypothetical protein n=1 Tax=Paraburkholderia susongensis TaxID=1515439 RepID=UPI001180502D|nr:hypothetical protein [Paraburkholderia susongensis]
MTALVHRVDYVAGKYLEVIRLKPHYVAPAGFQPQCFTAGGVVRGAGVRMESSLMNLSVTRNAPTLDSVQPSATGLSALTIASCSAVSPSALNHEAIF